MEHHMENMKKKSCFFCNEPEHSSDSEEDFSKDVLVNPKKTKGRRIDAVRDFVFEHPLFFSLTTRLCIAQESTITHNLEYITVYGLSYMVSRGVSTKESVAQCGHDVETMQEIEMSRLQETARASWV